MLVLSRKVGEKVVIDGRITVQIVSIDGNKVRVGIVAPDDVSVDRQEVHDKKHRAVAEWATSTPLAADLVAVAL
jgi:carbon storage regulator